MAMTSKERAKEILQVQRDRVKEGWGQTDEDFMTLIASHIDKAIKER